MKKLLFLIVFSLIWGITDTAEAGFNKAGRTALQFLKIGIGGRSSALGDACIANINDINAVYWNPAAITNIAGAQAGFNYIRWIGDINIMSGAVGYNFDGVGTIALSYVGLNYGNIQEALVSGPGGGADTRTGETFSGNDMSLGLTAARRFTDRLSIGVTVKYIREELFTYKSDLWAFDIGSYYDTGWKGIRLAMSAQNFSKQARWLHTLEERQQSFEVPLVYRLGWSIDLMGGENLFLGGNPEAHRITMNMDAVHTNDYSERLHLGLEYEIFGRIDLRAGYRFNYDEGQFSTGLGLKQEVAGLNLQLDYAYVDYDFLDSPHRVSMIISF